MSLRTPDLNDVLEIRTADNVGIGYEVAGIASRLIALIIDGLIIGVLVLLSDSLILGIVGSTVSTTAALVLGSFVSFLVIYGYFVVAETASSGRTPGKRVIGLRVIRVDGSAPTFSDSLVRNLVRFLDLPGPGVVAMFFHPQARRLGDLAAGTLVVRERPVNTTVAPAPAVMLRTPDAGPGIDGIERLGATEYAAVRAFLTRWGLTLEQRQRLAALLAQRLLDRLGLPAEAPERWWPPELFLERLYLQLSARLQPAR
jgi:uncharacterized RDD family membrane protein YckC